MITADKVAKYIINYCSSRYINLSNLKLQKLLYLVQGEYIRKYNQRLMPDDFYAWKLGPVIPNIYHKYSIYVSNSLPEEEIDFILDADLINLIESVLKRYAHMQTWDLVNLTKEQDPWKYIFEIYGVNSIIPFDTIRAYFEERKETLSVT